MFAAPPKITKITLNSVNSKILTEFYSELGMLFNEDISEDGLKIFTYIYDDFFFEIREVEDKNMTSNNLELRFLIDEIEGYRENIKQMDIEVVNDIWETENHQHILLRDPDNNLVELITENYNK